MERALKPQSAHPTSPAPSRDRALDMARGYAIVAMIGSHVGPDTGVSMLVNFPHLLSAADYFFLVSGAALGLVSERRLHSDSARPFYVQLLRRALRLYVVHCVLTLIVVLIHHLSGRLRSPDIAELGGWLGTLWQIASLRAQPVDYMNILPLFIVYFALSPALLELIRRRREGLLLALSALVWAAAQFHPNLLPLPKTGAEPNVFSLAAWQFPFTVGVVLGYHRLRLLEAYRSAPAWLRAGLLGFVAVQFLLAQFQRGHLRMFDLALSSEHEWLLSKQTFAPLHAIYAISFVVAGYAALRLLDAYVARTRSTLADALNKASSALETIGKYSLYCFVMHLPFALVASAANSSAWPRIAQNLFTIVAMVAVYWLTRLQGLVRALKL